MKQCLTYRGNFKYHGPCEVGVACDELFHYWTRQHMTSASLVKVTCAKPQESTGFLKPGRGGGGVLPIMAYTGRLRPKGVPFSGFRDFTS